MNGGTLDHLSFAIVGDTRPPTENDTAGYPTQIITTIWQAVQAENPIPAFAITTGDYMFADPHGSEAGPQLDIYLNARSAFSNTVFYAMGNHECTGGTNSNCGPGESWSNNYDQFMSKMMGSVGKSQPYYDIWIDATDHSWNAKFVVIAANAWNSAQEAWFDATLAKPSTYTFVVRHEGSAVTTTPGVSPSAQIMANHPLTLLLAGHTHTFYYSAGGREVITGNGGAPLSGSINYGYVIARQRANLTIGLTARDYATGAVIKTFAVDPYGAPAP